MENEPKIEQPPKINFNASNFAYTLRVLDLYKELGPESKEYHSDISEVVSNLSRMLPHTFDYWEDLETQIDRAFSGESSSLTTIKLPQDLKEKYKNLIVKKIKEQIQENNKE